VAGADLTLSPTGKGKPIASSQNMDVPSLGMTRVFPRQSTAMILIHAIQINDSLTPSGWRG
jgi:hypothetical protein